MKEMNSNKDAWSKVSEDHYHAFKARLAHNEQHFNHYIQQELGDITGKKVIHLQCNTGADTILLARLGASDVVGVDFVGENIQFAKKLASDFNVHHINFIEADMMKLSQMHHEKYDIVFTSEGVLGWLPDLNKWAQTIRSLLNDTGYVYIFDSHPIFLMFDEAKLDQEEFAIKYPYFGIAPDKSDAIGGYASAAKQGVTAYFWMHPLSEIINSLTRAGLHIESFHEYTENFFDSGHMELSDKVGLYQYRYNTDKYPMSFSLKASVYNK